MTRHSGGQARRRIPRAPSGWAPSCPGRRRASGVKLRRTPAHGRRRAAGSDRRTRRLNGCIDRREPVRGACRVGRVEARRRLFGDDGAPVDGDAHGARSRFADARHREFAHAGCFIQEQRAFGDAACESARGNGPKSSARFCARASRRPVGAGCPPGGGSTPNGRGGPSGPLLEGIGRTGGGCSQTTAVLARPRRRPHRRRRAGGAVPGGARRAPCARRTGRWRTDQGAQPGGEQARNAGVRARVRTGWL